MLTTGVGPIAAHHQAIEQGVTHVAGKAAPIAIEDGLLEGKDHRQPVDEAGHATRPPLPPSPHLRSHIEENRNAPAVGLPGHDQVEARIVHQHHQIRAMPCHLLLEQAHHPPVARNAAGDLHQPHRREHVHIRQDFHASSIQLGPTHTHHLGSGAKLAERPH